MISLTPFTFYLDWMICAQFAGLCWAKAKGLYEAVDLDVQLIPWQEDGRSIIDKVMMGGLCAGSSEDNLIVSAVANGHDVRAIGTMLQGTPLSLMSRKTQPIRGMHDLRGKRVGMHSDGIHALETILTMEGIPLNDLTIQEVTFDLEHLRQDRFDVLQGYAMTEPVQLAALGIEVDVLPVSHARLHPYAQVFFASADCITTDGAILTRFLAASMDGWRAAMLNLDETAHIIANLIGDMARTAEQRQMLDRLLPLVAGDLPSDQIGKLDIGQWHHNLETYHQFGLIQKALTIHDVLDTTLG